MLNSMLLNIGRVTSQLIGSYKLPDEIVKRRSEFDVSGQTKTNVLHMCDITSIASSSLQMSNIAWSLTSVILSPVEFDEPLCSWGAIVNIMVDCVG